MKLLIKWFSFPVLGFGKDRNSVTGDKRSNPATKNLLKRDFSFVKKTIAELTFIKASFAFEAKLHAN